MRGDDVAVLEAEVAATALPGDVLLMRGKGEVSTLVSWLGESRYSHAGLVGRDGKSIEAILGGVAETPLPDLLDLEGILSVDLFRPKAHDGSAFGVADRRLVVDEAVSMLGTDFAVGDLVTVGMLVAMRDKPRIENPWLRVVVMRALEQLRADDATRLVCSEFVYRCLRDCAASPRGRLRPVILEPQSNPMGPLRVNVPALIDELWDLLNPHGLLDAELSPPDTADAPVPEVLQVSEKALDELHAEVRVRLGIPEAQTLSMEKWLARRELAHPNPELIRPRDLEISPSLAFVARLK